MDCFYNTVVREQEEKENWIIKQHKHNNVRYTIVGPVSKHRQFSALLTIPTEGHPPVKPLQYMHSPLYLIVKTGSPKTATITGF